ncbi:MAG: aliphatic sulfonate ABC transporter substrate-binding protein, partial [Thermomicrobiales bacterium]|nr:aliphatic sulfonate ABC transporter substrate-binding protein [Thermomicrobiales bacterium]
MTLKHLVAARPTRRGLLRLGLTVAGVAALPSFAFLSPAARAAGGEVRIGYQKGSQNLLVLKAQNLLAPVLDPLGYTVVWTEFPAGPPLLEALNAGALDFGSTGAPPPIFAQAGGADLIYAAAATPSPLEEGILVPQDSPIQTVTDLKGKKVAVAKGSSANAFLAYALEGAGLTWGDVEATYLLPADAKAAFDGGSVDAWAIWDPYAAVAEDTSDARSIADGKTANHTNRSFYLASRPFATEHAAALAAIISALVESDAWAGAHPADVAAMVAGETGIDEATLLKVEQRSAYGIEPIDPAIIAEQQALADMFLDLGLIPAPIDVASATLPVATPAA